MALLQIIETTAIVLLLYIVARAIQRLYFSPLSHIPGPKLAALTWWYEFYFDVIQQGRYVFKIEKLHKQYDTIYASSLSRRDKYAYQLRSLRIPGSIGASVRHDVHKKRREALAPFFSKRNVLHLEPVITKKVEQLSQVIGKHAAAQTPINLSDVFFGFSNDVVTNFLFAHQVDVLSDEKKAATVRHNTHELLLGVHVNKHFKWIPDFLESLPKSISKNIMPPGLIDMMALLGRVRTELIGIMETKSSKTGDESNATALGPTGKESVYHSVLDSPVLPPEEKSLLRLQQEGALLVLAGTESPGHSLSTIFYHLCANPAILEKLRNELSTDPMATSWADLQKMPYLSAVIEEGNRLSFGVTNRMARIAPEALIYTPSPYASSPGKSYTIPPRTPVSTSTFSAHTAERVFPDPFVFQPERWIGGERRKFQMAFGKGSRKCLGIELAHAELSLVVATLVRRFDFQLWETDERDVEFVHSYQVAMPNMKSKGALHGLALTAATFVIAQLCHALHLPFYDHPDKMGTSIRPNNSGGGYVPVDGPGEHAPAATDRAQPHPAFVTDHGPTLFLDTMGSILTRRAPAVRMICSIAAVVLVTDFLTVGLAANATSNFDSAKTSEDVDPAGVFINTVAGFAEVTLFAILSFCFLFWNWHLVYFGSIGLIGLSALGTGAYGMALMAISMRDSVCGGDGNCNEALKKGMAASCIRALLTAPVCLLLAFWYFFKARKEVIKAKAEFRTPLETPLRRLDSGHN
ncbi:hypothetical protein V497_01285 [Pseudogymnoascus sp. VKM F-4516 (FW-969)]|nr:hypothetical protein V497_01285 [Pseudogymnoascus sp. VKM F-4516 (FW-969)]